MPDIKFSELPAAGALDADDILALTQDLSGTLTSGKVTLATLLAWLIANGSGAPSYTINVQSGTSYTAVLGDAGNMVAMTNAAANTVEIPPNADVAFPVGTRIDLAQDGAGQTTVLAGSGVTINSRHTLKLVGQFAKGSVIKRDTNEWDLVGELEEIS